MLSVLPLSPKPYDDDGGGGGGDDDDGDGDDFLRCWWFSFRTAGIETFRVPMESGCLFCSLYTSRTRSCKQTEVLH